ncbi:MAG: hypothetical protein ACHP7J_00965 [Terriglobales bacterium]
MANKKRKLTPILQLKIHGPGVRRGRISVPDLIRICQEAQNVVNKQAEVIKGRKTIHPGPTSGPIQQECTLDLIGIEDGSATLQFDLAKAQTHFQFKEHFGAKVVAEVATTIRSLKTHKQESIDPGLLLSIYGLSGLVETKGISGIRWITPQRNGFKPASVPITRMVRENVAVRLSRPQKVLVHVDGILDMADFKPEEFKCRIDPPIGVSITCVFDRERANDIYNLLRKPVRAKGEATLKPYTDRIDSIHIEEISPLPSLHLGEGNFFANPSIEELAVLQKVKPLKDMSVLSGGIPDDEDVDKLVEGIYTARK